MFFAVVIAAVAACVWAWSSARRQRELSWPSTQALVLEHRLVTTGKRDDTEIVVRYVAGRQTVERALFWDGSDYDFGTHKRIVAGSAPPVGSQISIHYDPNEVDDAALDYEPQRRASAWEIYFGTSAMFVGWALIARLLAKLGDVWVAAKRPRRRSA